MKTPRSDEEDDETHGLVRAGPSADLAGPEALAHLLAQSNREATANRAQARELVKALEGVQRSQEYLGTALRDERRRSRWLVVVAVLAPVAAAAGAWYVWRHVDETRSALDDRIVRLAADAERTRADDAARAADARVAELAADLDTVRGDLDASRDALAAERKHLTDREAALTSAQSRSDGARTEIGALEFEVRAAKQKTTAAEARGAVLEQRVKDLQAELAAAAKPAPAPPAPVAAAPVAESKPAAASKPPAPIVAAANAPAAAPAEVEKARTVLNILLKESGDSVRYEFAALGGLEGRSLTGVRLVGTDDAGNVVRTIVAARAEIATDDASGSVVIRFFDGKLLVGLIEAPFYDGTYGLIVRGDPKKWRSCGLACVK